MRSAQELSIAQEIVGIALDNALIGDIGACKHVDADELCTDRSGNAQSCHGVVSQAIDAQDEVGMGFSYGLSDHRHHRRMMRRHELIGRALGEWG